MFSGIVEALEPILSVTPKNDICVITVKRPEQFDDIKLGDSIAVDGVCLTVEKFNETEIQFTLGAETLLITQWLKRLKVGAKLNLERSLRFGDRIHGHFVSGHVDTLATLEQIEKNESWVLRFRIQQQDSRYVWAKGSIALNGTSLTINRWVDSLLEVCLIPETQLRTNFAQLSVGDIVHVEYDSWAKAFVNFQEQRGAGV